MTALRHFLLAIQYFTRIPITGSLATWVGFSPELLSKSAGHFPGVGFLVGSLSALSLWGSDFLFPDSPFLIVFISLLVSILITGAFHEDGLADVADGLGGSLERDRALEIMKDSRLGTFGTLALILILGIKVSVLSSLLSHSLLATLLTLVLAHVLSRFLPLITIQLLAPLTDRSDSKSKPLIETMPRQTSFTGVIWVLIVFTGISMLHPLTAWGGGLLFAIISYGMITAYFQKRLQGFTGDCLGATQQITEVSFYLGTLACLS